MDFQEYLEEYAEEYAMRQIIQMYASLVRRGLISADVAAEQLQIEIEKWLQD